MKRRLIKERLFYIYCLLSFSVAALALFAILASILYNGIGAIMKLGTSLFDVPSGVPVGTEGGIGNAIAGTLMLIWVASFCIFIGVGVGMFLAEYKTGFLATIVRTFMDILAWIPSIVWGMFGYAVFVVLADFRFSVLAGGFTLGLFMLPYIARYTEEALRMVPIEIREAAFSLGAQKWRVMIQIMVRAAIAGIVAGIIIGLARIFGETAPLLFTSYWNNFIPRNLFEPAASLPYLIWYYSQFPYEDMHVRAYASAFILVLIVSAFVFISRLTAKFLKFTYR